MQRSARALDQELDAQLVGLARLVTAPAGRAPVEGRPRVTIASDLHNNVLALPILERAAGGGPVFFPGDLSDRGSPLETLAARARRAAGRPFVFVTGNHDSDAQRASLADDGAIVLTQYGRLEPRRRLRAGRQRSRACASRATPTRSSAAPPRTSPTASTRSRRPLQQQELHRWLRPLIGKVDVVLVHEPALIAPALDELETAPPSTARCSSSATRTSATWSTAATSS